MSVSWLARCCGLYNLVRSLVQRGADVTMRDKYGTIATMIFVEQNTKEKDFLFSKSSMSDLKKKKKRCCIV